jgi:hypothetical protein
MFGRCRLALDTIPEDRLQEGLSRSKGRRDRSHPEGLNFKSLVTGKPQSGVGGSTVPASNVATTLLSSKTQTLKNMVTVRRVRAEYS